MRHLENIDVTYAEQMSACNFKMKRDCFSQLKDFMTNDVPVAGTICALYGLWRTGKTVMMRQCIDELSEEQRKKCCYIICRKSCDLLDLRRVMDELIEEGIRFFFIDEITEVEGFQIGGNLFSDYYPLYGARIAIAGTDSLGIRLAAMDILYDRMKVIHTSQISYAEFSRLLGGKGIEQYIEYGGTLTDTQYKDVQSRDEFVHSAIARNILNSLEKNEEVRHYHALLTELYDNEELTSVIKKMINKFSYITTARAINRCFKSAPLYATRYNLNKKNYAGKLNDTEAKEEIKKTLGVKDVNEMKFDIKETHIDELKFYLKELDLFVQIPSYGSLKRTGKGIDNLEILMQPGMIYAHAAMLLDVLTQDKFRDDSVTKEEQQEFKHRADNLVKGILLENIILSETYVWMQSVDKSKYYVSKLSVTLPESTRRVEAGMIIVDTEADEAYLFEAVYSEERGSEQTEHLKDEEFMDYVNENFGNVKSCTVIYNGTGGIEDGVTYQNAEKFLSKVHQMQLEKTVDIQKLLSVDREI